MTLYGFWQFTITAFVTLLVVVDPLGLAPLFVALTNKQDTLMRRAILSRAIAIALGVTLFFLFIGRATLNYLGVSLDAVGISGGILLFATSLPMLFGSRSPAQRPDEAESDPESEDISIFPLAIPLLAGPGTITTVLLLTTRSEGQILHSLSLTVAIVAVFILSYWVLYWSELVVRCIGSGGVHIATRVMGILLSALAVQFVLNGLSGYYGTLMSLSKVAR